MTTPLIDLENRLSCELAELKLRQRQIASYRSSHRHVNDRQIAQLIFYHQLAPMRRTVNELRSTIAKRKTEK